MESSITELSARDEVLVELYGALGASRREESYIPLESLASILVECLRDGEPQALAELILSEYDKRQAVAA